MKRNGVKAAMFPSAIESLVRQVITGRHLANINPLVNLGNLVAIRHLTPVGLFSASVEIHLRHTRSGERFTEIGRSESVGLNEGEICYATPSAVITRHFVWRQGEEAKVTPGTRDFFFVSEVLPELEPVTASRVLDDFVQDVGRYFNIRMRAGMLTSQPSEWSFAG